MKKVFTILLVLASAVTMRAEVLFNQPYTLGNDWTDFQQFLVSNVPVLSNVQAGDVIAITVTAAAADAQMILQNTSWVNLGNEYAISLSAPGVYAFALTDSAATQVSTSGFILKGINYTLTKIELLYRKTIWTGELSDNSGWQVVQLPSGTFADLTSGALLGVDVSAINNGAAWHQYSFGVNWRSSVLDGSATMVKTYIHSLTDAQVDSLVNQPVLTLAAQYLDVTALYTYTSTRSAEPAGENQTIWTGNTDFGTAWGVWVTLPASAFVNAVAGQLLRFRFTDLRAGAQLKVSKGDWSDMPDTEIAAISGRYQDFSVTANNLTELQANGAIISGLGFTLTEVQLLNPASLRPLMLSVPVTDNWIFNGKPSITIHVENPYNEAVTANAEVQIATDKMAAVTTLYQSVEVPAGSSQDIVLTTAENLVPGFYKATCIVNDDLARAFVFGVNPFDIVSAPDKQPDFDTFWAAAKAELAQVPMNATLTEITAKSTAARKVYLVEMQSIADTVGGAPVIVRGYYCEPQDGQQHPVIMHYLGYDSGYRPGGQDVMPYCPSGDAEPAYAEFYLSTRGQSVNNRAAGEREPDGKGDFTNIYGDWFAYHFGDKDCYYYRGAFMDCVRAIQFMATRPTSDMTNLFAEGQSQGGAFTYAAASLTDHPFKAIAPAIAFLGDYPDYFDIVSWPAYVARDNQGTMTDAQMFAFLSYFDTKNLATSISCPTIACIGLQDNVCPPHTNIAPYNNLLSTDKQMLFNPELMHQASATWYADFMAFFASHITTNPSALEQTNTGVCNTQKMICDGQLILLRDGQAYNAIGQIITH